MADNVPTVIRGYGDISKAKGFVGFAKQGMEVLKNLMSFNNLDTYSMVKKFDDGTVVYFSSCFGINKVDIVCPILSSNVVKEEISDSVLTPYKPVEPVDLGGDYYIFYLDDTTLKVANCTYAEDIAVKSTKAGVEIRYNNAGSAPVTFHCKRFTHNVPANGVTVARDLYFIATSLYINPNPYQGWVNFAAANPTFGLVINNANTQIELTLKVLADLQRINSKVNREHTYISDPDGNDYWHILADGEAGDCEDFALTKADLLLKMGYPASAIHIETGMITGSPTPQIGHAWLVVQTTGGDYALDLNSNKVAINSSLKFGDKEFFSRRRQIGSNWAFISPFGWLLSSWNTSLIYTYILDPLLNIFYLMGSSSLERVNGHVNFSADNNAIYEQYLGDGWTIYKYKLEENKLTKTLFASSDGGFVNRDGTTSAMGADYEIISANGYYNFQQSPDDPEISNYSWALMNKVFGSPFYLRRNSLDENQSYYIFPNGEAIRYTFTVIVGAQEFIGNYYLPYSWVHIDTDSNTPFIHGCQLRCIRPDLPDARPDVKRVYKNGVSCLSEVITAVSTTETNLFGIAYTPCTDRLNITKEQEVVRKRLWYAQQDTGLTILK